MKITQRAIAINNYLRIIHENDDECSNTPQTECVQLKHNVGNKDNNKITELRTILQRKSQNS
jgi:hypothetical protein